MEQGHRSVSFHLPVIPVGIQAMKQHGFPTTTFQTGRKYLFCLDELLVRIGLQQFEREYAKQTVQFPFLFETY